MATVINTTFKLKRAKALRWIELNPILETGEPGFVKDENRLKIGDGVTDWINLPYIGEDNVQNFNKMSEFPSSGRSNVIYKAEQEKAIYQWNTTIKAYELIGSIGGEFIVDDELSDISTNPVQNKIITAYLRDFEAKEEARPVNKLLSSKGGVSITLAAADNLTIIEKIGEYGTGMFTLLVEAGVIDSPTDKEVCGLCQVTSWDGIDNFNAWIMLLSDKESFTQTIVNGKGLGWNSSNTLENIKIINGGNANG